MARRLSELRQQGHGWSEVAEIMGGTADGRRMHPLKIDTSARRTPTPFFTGGA